MKIMLIDDDPLCLQSLKLILTAAGYKVEAFSDPEEAVANFDASYGIVISDVMMPKCDGFEVLRQVKAQNPATGVILITGFKNEGDVVAAYRLGAYRVLAKPLNIFFLIAWVQELEEKLHR